MKDRVACNRNTVRGDPYAAAVRTYKDRSLRCESCCTQIELRGREGDAAVLNIVTDDPVSGEQDAAPYVDILRKADPGAVLTGVSHKKRPVLRTRLEAVVGAQQPRHIAAALTQVLDEDTALATAVAAYGTRNGRSEAVGRIVQADRRLVAFFHAPRMFVVPPVLGVEEPVIKFRIDVVTEASLSEGADGRIFLDAHFVKEVWERKF